MTDLVQFAYQPRPWQLRVHALMAGHRYTVVVVHRRGGKTYLACNTLITAAMAKPEGRFAYVAPLLKQAKAISWALFKQLCAPIPGVQFKDSELLARFPNGATIQLFSGESHDDIRGQGFDGVVLDEFAQFPIDAWGSSIRPTLSDRHGWALMIGTPRGLDLLHEFFMRGQDHRHDEWCSASFPVTDTGVLSEHEIESAKRAATTEAQFRREYLCDFGASTDDVLIPLPLVSAAMARSVTTKAALTGMPKILGVDVARFGDDRSVLFFSTARSVWAESKFFGAGGPVACIVYRCFPRTR
jgi:hypothetical protein